MSSVFVLMSAMPRIADEILFTHIEVALAVASEATLVGLGAADPRTQRNARVDLARHLVERMQGLEIEGEGIVGRSSQPTLFPGDLSPMG